MVRDHPEIIILGRWFWGEGQIWPTPERSDQIWPKPEGMYIKYINVLINNSNNKYIK